MDNEENLTGFERRQKRAENTLKKERKPMNEILETYKKQIEEIEVLYRRGSLTIEERYHLRVLRTVDLHKALLEFMENN